jgi:hypothetical protein
MGMIFPLFCGSLAQSVEHRTFNPLVVRSIRTRPTTLGIRRRDSNTKVLAVRYPTALPYHWQLFRIHAGQSPAERS